MSETARAWLFGLLGWSAMGLVAYAPLPWEMKLAFWVVVLNVTDDFGGRWFGYIGILLGALGFFNPTESWWTTYPLMFFVLWAFLLLKHTLHVYGVVIGMLGVLGLFAALKIAVPLLDPSLRLLTSNTFILPVLVAFLIASIVHVWVFFSSNRTNGLKTTQA
ncbi:hypothetical protein [Deinococcus roseus]|uniref:Rod shape-determining protein MreD n=1 Tax=Deinococcus roseus TaxID=392414 RepID=A0ABQ2CXB7_9DEIO|nr:hypothetical protein [Deinococcus roseus]GGJ30224.1 hypothetical protein GCM10008938_15290 [Deinococcus roseus]